MSVPAGPSQGDATYDMEPRQRRTAVTLSYGEGVGEGEG